MLVLFLAEITFKPTVLAIFVVVIVAIVFGAIIIKNQYDGSNLFGEMGGKQAKKTEVDPKEEEYLRLIQLGNDMASKFQLPEALEYFRQALEIKRSDVSLLFKMGRLFTQLADHDHAIHYFKQTLRMDRDHIEAHYELARSLMVQNKYKKAYQVIEEALKKAPQHVDLLKLKLKIFTHKEDFRSALSTIDELLALDTGKETQLHYQETRVDLLIQSGNDDAAIALLKQLIDDYPYRKADFALKLSELLFKSEKFTEASSLLQELSSDEGMAENPKMKHYMAAAKSNEGVQWFETGDYEKSIQCYLEALEYDNENADIYYNLGKAYAMVGILDDAIHAYLESIRLDANQPESHYELAELYEKENQLEKAKTHYLQCLEFEPKHFKALFKVGTLFGLQGNYEGAVEYLSEAVKLKPSDCDSIYNLAVGLERLGQSKKAYKLYEQVLKMNPNHLEARANFEHMKKSLKK